MRGDVGADVANSSRQVVSVREVTAEGEEYEEAGI